METVSWRLSLLLEVIHQIYLFIELKTNVAVTRIKRYWKHEKKDSDIDLPLPPGSMGYPFIGETYQFLTKCPTGEFFRERYSKYGSIFRTNFLGMNNIHVSDLAHVKKMLMGEHHLVKVFWPPAMTNLLGQGALATSVEAPHRCLRKSIKQAMNSEAIKQYAPRMIRCISEELERWSREGIINVYENAKNLTMKTACEVVFGPEHAEDSVVEQLANDFVQYGDGFFQLPLPFPGCTYYKAVQAKKRILKTLEKLEQQGLKHSSILKSIFTAHEQETTTSPEEQSNLTVEILFGAQETTACTITCAMYVLERNPRVLHQLRTEIEDHINIPRHHDGTVWDGIENIHSLRYLNNVMMETLRMFPPIGGGFRKVLKTFELGGYKIPENWTITYSIKDLHEGSELNDVTQFDPEHWEAESEHNLQFTHFLPFGAGARACIGKEYAKLFVKLTLIALVSNYKWSMEGQQPTFTRVPIVKPVKPLMANFSSR